MSMIRNVTVDLGPRDLVIGGKVVATVDNVHVYIGEATEEELAALKAEPVILLVNPLPERIYKEAKHELQGDCLS